MIRYFLILIYFFSSFIYSQEALARKELTKILESQLYVRELTNHNDGVEVANYLESVGLGTGYPWCAAFVTYNLDACSFPNPQSAWSPDFAKLEDMIWSNDLVKKHKEKQPKACDVFTIYYSKLHRVGHVGFYLETAPNGYFITIEGNTNNNGSRQGIGVFKRKRDPRKIYRVTDYITPYYK